MKNQRMPKRIKKAVKAYFLKKYGTKSVCRIDREGEYLPQHKKNINIIPKKGGVYGCNPMHQKIYEGENCWYMHRQYAETIVFPK